MKNWKVMIQLLALCFGWLSWASPTHASSDYESPISIKLVNDLGNPHDIQLSIKGQIIIKEDPTISLTANVIYRITSGTGTLTLASDSGIVQTFNQTFTLIPINYSTENQIIINQKPYLGNISFTLEGQTIRPINTLPLEDYLKGVIPSEMPASWPLEALKAQAVAARTYILTKKDKVIDDTTNYQVYSGYHWYEKSTAAVEQTKGQFLKETNGALAQAVYSSSNGGIIEASQNAWGESSVYSYLTAKEDPYDPKNPWTLSFHRNQIAVESLDLTKPDNWWNQTHEVDPVVSKNLKDYLQKNGFANTEIKITAIPIFIISDAKTSGKRATSGNLSVEFFVKDSGGYRVENGQLKTFHLDYNDLSMNQIRRLLDPLKVKSNLVESLNYDGELYTLVGLGFGHGVGMSQYGAKAMADQGKEFKDILAFYYPGTLLAGSTTDSQLAAPGAIPTSNSQNNIPEPSFNAKGSENTAVVPPSSVNPPISSDNRIIVTIQLNEKKIGFPDQQPYIDVKDHRTMVPVRFVSESLGAKVDWDPKKQVVTISQGDRQITLKIGEMKATVDNRSLLLDAKATVTDNRTFVPLRFITETFGGKVTWDPSTKTVNLMLR